MCETTMSAAVSIFIALFIIGVHDIIALSVVMEVLLSTNTIGNTHS